MRNFNPLHREGGDKITYIDRFRSSRFQSTPPRGWRRKWGNSEDYGLRDFNPLHREGGDLPTVMD